MRIAVSTILSLCACGLLQADFSYTQTVRITGGMLAAMAGKNAPKPTNILLKGQKLKTDDGNTAVIIDLDAQTITSIDNSLKTYTVRDLGDLKGSAADLNATVAVKETGQTKTVNGFNATEAILTMEINAPAIGKANVEVDIWLSTEIAGSQELKAFFTRNAGNFPWQALGGAAGAPGMGPAMSELQKKMTGMKGGPVQQIIRIKAPDAMLAAQGAAAPPPGPSAAQLGQMQASLEQARKQLEAVAAQGGPAAAIAKQQLARMGPPPAAQTGGDPAAAGAANWLLEMTVDSSGFSDTPIPDAVFTIPAGFQKR